MRIELLELVLLQSLLDHLVRFLFDLVGEAGDHPRHVDPLLALAPLDEPGREVLVNLGR